jgi:hypothetical protein
MNPIRSLLFELVDSAALAVVWAMAAAVPTLVAEVLMKSRRLDF